MLVTIIAEHDRLAGRDVHDQARARRDPRRVLQSRTARRAGMGTRVGAARPRARVHSRRRAGWTNWIAGIVAVYSTLFGIGKIIFGDVGVGFVLLVIAAVAFAWIARSFRNEVPPPALALTVEERIAAD